jgi:hypothetical protein
VRDGKVGKKRNNGNPYPRQMMKKAMGELSGPPKRELHWDSLKITDGVKQ